MVAKLASNTTATNSHDWLTPREVDEYLRTGVDLIYDACATGGLKHVKLWHRTIRVRRAWVDAWTEAKATEAGSTGLHPRSDRDVPHLRVNPAHHLFFDPRHDVR